MQVEGRTVVVTGAASGIGRALALRLAAEGARGVVVSDVDEAGATTVAAEIELSRPGAALAIRCDVAQPGEVTDLIDRAEEAFGSVDLFCANAGVGGGAGLQASDELWDAAFDVNVRSHLVAARRLLPGWLDRGEGYFLSTASAAGLLSQVGAAAYTVTKHAAVAFAEWLAIAYGDRGVRVSCLCPMAVRTKLLEEGLALGGDAAHGLRMGTDRGALLEPEEVADAVVEALADERFLILPHPEVQVFLERKVADRDRWIDGMRRLQAQYAEAPTA